jgi:hypothetical protein
MVDTMVSEEFTFLPAPPPHLRRKLTGHPLSSIVDYFRRDPVSLYQGIPKVEKRIREADGFREKLVGLEKNSVEGCKIGINK